MGALIVLVHAPVLGPATWQPVAAELSRAGHRVDVPSLAGFCAGGAPCAPRLIQRCADQLALSARPGAQAEPPGTMTAQAGSREAPERVVLVLHSGAGPFAEHLAAAIAADRVTVIFADASLPARSGAVPVVDAAFLPYLREIARDGMVPAWHEWWPGADASELFPNEAARAAVLADARPLPLAFFEETLPPLSPSSSDGRRGRDDGYLLFSAPYRREAGVARRHGWPVTELAGSHLHMLVSPAEVAAAIVGLTGQLATC